MNYALAKKLKDAGYPQPLIAYTHMWKRDGSGVKAYCPDLEELIMKCGDDIESLFKVFKKDRSSKAEDGMFGGWEAIKDSDTWYWGETPKEAVANLWLEINK